MGRVLSHVSHSLCTALLLLAAGSAAAATANITEARKLYQTTQYEQALQLLEGDSSVEALQLTGQALFQQGEFKKATEVFEKAIEQRPNSSELHLWAGRTYGRRAEAANPLFAARYASRTRQHFEKSVELDPKNILAMNDLFEYYLQAPGFMGGGRDKAEALAKRIAALDKAEGHYAASRLAQDRNDQTTAEQQLRLAMEAAPTQVGRILDLARYLARRSRIVESDALFDKAAEIAPNNPKVLFERGASYVETKRNADQARALLQKYLEAPLTPDDPPRADARKLLSSL
jgi:tetratricopeptide (TPR) repeat protein